jgi:hypothetical protein
MSYLTLTEAAQYVSEKTGIEIEPAALLRTGALGHLLIVAYFDSLMHNLSAHRNDDVLGHLVVPPRYLAKIENEGQAVIEGAFSLDGKNAYAPFVMRTRDQLRVLVKDLDGLIPRVVSATPKASIGTKKKLTVAQEKEIRQKHEKGESIASLAKVYGVSRPTIDRCFAPKEATTLQDAWGTQKPTRRAK